MFRNNEWVGSFPFYICCLFLRVLSVSKVSRGILPAYILELSEQVSTRLLLSGPALNTIIIPILKSL